MGWLRWVGLSWVWLSLVMLSPPLVSAQAFDEEDSESTFGFEIKGGYRDSDLARFPVNFGFAPEQLPPGSEGVFLETVEAGDHTELNVVTLWYRGSWTNGLAAKVKVDLIDRHDRNPTSEDDEWDVDELWLRYGPEVEPGDYHEGVSGYVRVGKFGKFERQDDRHLESYGMMSTVFNRAEDTGLEIGVDAGRHVYLKASVTQGNPVFIRDPNALAGDNGTSAIADAVLEAEPDLKFGIPVFYDADIEDVSFDEPEIGLGLGLRFGDDTGRWALDILGWAYERDLAETVDLTGTFYGGDLDILRGPFNQFPYAITDTEKSEAGANLWFYAGGLSVFAQVVDSELGGLQRKGYEVEVAWDVELPYRWAAFGRQLLPFIAPAVRFSHLDPQFGPPRVTPLPSAAWEWDKLDLGVRIGLIQGVDLTVEWNDNEFIRGGRAESADEFLATVRWNWSRGL